MSRFQACLLTPQAETQTAGQRSEEIARCVGPQKSGLMRALFQLDPVTKIDWMVDNPVNAEYSFLVTFQSEATSVDAFNTMAALNPMCAATVFNTMASDSGSKIGPPTARL